MAKEERKEQEVKRARKVHVDLLDMMESKVTKGQWVLWGQKETKA